MDTDEFTHLSSPTHSCVDIRGATEQRPPDAISYRSVKLNTLEFGRGLAALFVLLYHYKSLCAKYTGTIPSLSGPFAGGHAGVEYFFVLSGFIIYLTHGDEIGKKRKVSRFFVKRMVRILPTYWIIITIMLVTFKIDSSWGGEKNLDIITIVKDYLLIGHSGAKILPPAWTLEREAFFYILFGIAIAIAPVGIFMFLFWQIMILLINTISIVVGKDLTIFSPFFLDIHNIGFSVGIGCFILSSRLQAKSNILIFMTLCIGLACVTANMYTECVQFAGVSDVGVQTFQEQALHSFFYTIGFGLIVFGLVEIELRSRLNLGVSVSMFGASSYLIYLLHEPLASFLIKFMHFSGILSKLSANGLYILEIALVLSAAMLLHHLVERPITRRLRLLYAQGDKSRTSVNSP